MKTLLKNLATFQLKQAKLKSKIDQPLFKELIFQPILHRFRSNIVYYTITHPVPSWMFCVNVALFGSNMTEPFINVQTHTHVYIHTYIQHSANYSEIIIIVVVVVVVVVVVIIIISDLRRGCYMVLPAFIFFFFLFSATILSAPYLWNRHS